MAASSARLNSLQSFAAWASTTCSTTSSSGRWWVPRASRVWGLWDPREVVRAETVESRNRRWQWFAWPASLATLVVGVIGLRVLARKGRQIAMLVAPVLMTTFLVLVTYGNTRFRTAAEPALLIGVAAAVLSSTAWLKKRIGSDGAVSRESVTAWS